MTIFQNLRRRSMYAGLTVASLAATLGVAVPAMRNSTAQETPAASPVLSPSSQSILTRPYVAQAPSRSPAPTPAEPAPTLPQPAQSPAATSPTTAPTPAASPAEPPAASEQKLQLKRLTAEQLHARLETALDRKLPRLEEPASPWLRFTLETGEQAPVLAGVHTQTGEVRLVGRGDQLRAWGEIISVLDAPREDGKVTQVVAADKNAAPHVRQAVNVLLAQAQQPAAPPTQAGQPNAAQPGAAQPAPAPAAGDQAVAASGAQGVDAGVVGAAANALAETDGLLGPVQIEVIEGTEYFVIRGNPRDVQHVMEVIRQIEAMTRVSEPIVTVVPIQNVDSQSIARLLTQMFAPAAAPGSFSLAPYYGPLLSLPLGKPNAVLLVGAPSTVEKATGLLKQLDIRGEALSTFEVFRLKHARAEEAQTVISQVFIAEEAEATGVAPPLGAKALVIAEPRTNSLIVRAGPRDMEEVRQMVQDIDAPGGERVNEIRIFKLKNGLAAELAPVLQRAVRNEPQAGNNPDTEAGVASLLRLITIDAEGQQSLESGVLAGVTVNADTRANSLIVSAPAESMPLMAALIAQLDVAPDAVAQLKVFTIENGDAVSLAEMLQGLFGTGEQGGQGQGGGGTANQAAAGARIFQLRFEVDERTNSIIAAGSNDELLVVEAVLLRLDASEARQRTNNVYKLKNASAEQVAIALQEWLEQKREVEQTAPGVTSPFQQIEREVVVVAEVNSNSLIVSATPTYFEEIRKIIAQLDEQAPMVMIQVLIGEVRLGDADEFGVELGLQDSALFDRSLLENIEYQNTTQVLDNQQTIQTQTIVSANQNPGFNFGNPAQGLPNSGSERSLATAGRVAGQGLASFGVGRVNNALGFGGLVLSASSESVSMLLRALQESRRLEVLSRPQIMALDNQRGRAFVGEIVPIVDNVIIGTAGTPPQTIVRQEPVGLELYVRPRISPDNLVVMEVFAAKRELGPISQGVPVGVAANGDPILVPRINSTEAETTVSAVDGQTVVLSGLLTKRDEALHRRVPLLADIPLLGNLFRFDSTSTIRTELLIVLTPHVVRSRHEAEMIKQIESARMSWCLNDVVDMHGPAGLRSRSDMIGAAEAETIFPSMVPSDLGVAVPDEHGLMPPPTLQPAPLQPRVLAPIDDAPLGPPLQ
jgi:general secretion pathway protein D